LKEIYDYYQQNEINKMEMLKIKHLFEKDLNIKLSSIYSKDYINRRQQENKKKMQFQQQMGRFGGNNQLLNQISMQSKIGNYRPSYYHSPLS